MNVNHVIYEFSSSVTEEVFAAVSLISSLHHHCHDLTAVYQVLSMKHSNRLAGLDQVSLTFSAVCRTVESCSGFGLVFQYCPNFYKVLLVTNLCESLLILFV